MSQMDSGSQIPGRKPPPAPEQQPTCPLIGFSIASMVTGIISLFSWCLPCAGIPVSLTGLALGIISLAVTRSGRGMAVSGVVMCSIGLIVNVWNCGWGMWSG